MAKTAYTFLMILFFGAAAAQPDTTRVDSVRVPNKYMPTGIRVGADLISFIKTQRQANFDGYEFTADIDFERYLLAVDYGMWERHFGVDSAKYDNSGTYWRVGADANFITNDRERNVFSLGIRYGRSSYTETMTYILDDDIWGAGQQTITQPMSAGWVELTTGLKVKIWKFLWMGYTGRYKFALGDHETDDMISHDVPGYGLTNKNATWGFNYYVFLRIPVRPVNTPILPRNKKK